MAFKQRTKIYIFLAITLLLFVFLTLSSRLSDTSAFSYANLSKVILHQHTSSHLHHHDDPSLTELECSRFFPGLTKEIDEAISLGSFRLPFKDAAILQGRIQSGQLYVLRAPLKGELSDVMRHRQLATLHQIHRAIITSPEPIPNTSFAFTTKDLPQSDTMSYARPVVSPSRKRIWPMPHFSYWSWPVPFIDSISSKAQAITAIETSLPFHNKDPRAIWRGTTWFNNGAGSNPRLRHELVAMAKGQPWADVEALNWTTDSVEASNALKIEDFCRYKYIVNTEGIGYSGRLQYHQLCESVLLTPPLEWMQHTTHLIRPIFSSTILGTQARPSSHTSERIQRAWPVESSLEDANAVFVAGDWSDLEEIVQWLEENPDAAAGLARRQRQTFAEHGYMSVAAEVCYWRALIKGWAKVVVPTGDKWLQAGVRFEDFATIGELQQ